MVSLVSEGVAMIIEAGISMESLMHIRFIQLDRWSRSAQVRLHPPLLLAEPPGRLTGGTHLELQTFLQIVFLDIGNGFKGKRIALENLRVAAQASISATVKGSSPKGIDVDVVQICELLLFRQLWKGMELTLSFMTL